MFDVKRDIDPEDGENKVLRSFLGIYSGGDIRIANFIANFEITNRSWAIPDWARNRNNVVKLTKAEAQLWIRYILLFEKEI